MGFFGITRRKRVAEFESCKPLQPPIAHLPTLHRQSSVKSIYDVANLSHESETTLVSNKTSKSVEFAAKVKVISKRRQWRKQKRSGPILKNTNGNVEEELAKSEAYWNYRKEYFDDVLMNSSKYGQLEIKSALADDAFLRLQQIGLYSRDNSRDTYASN